MYPAKSKIITLQIGAGIGSKPQTFRSHALLARCKRPDSIYTAGEHGSSFRHDVIFVENLGLLGHRENGFENRLREASGSLRKLPETSKGFPEAPAFREVLRETVREASREALEGFPECFPQCFPGGFAEGFPETLPERFPEGFTEYFPGGFAEGFPESFPDRLPKEFPGGFPEGVPKGFPRN
jgi:hypothetical protein